MTMLDVDTRRNHEGLTYRPTPLPVGETAVSATYDQMLRFVVEVKPKLQWQEHLGRMAVNHPNIELGVEK